MCVIIDKPEGIDINELTKAINAGWIRNSDGAGYCVIRGNRIEWSKGYMTAKTLINSISKNVKKSDRVICHLRYATHGAVVRALTHPFLISETRTNKKMRSVLRKGETLFFHNGVDPMADPEPGESDTSQIALELAPESLVLGMDENRQWLKDMFEDIGRVMTVRMGLNGRPAVRRYGNWIRSGGCVLSNADAIPWTRKTTTPSWDDQASRFYIPAKYRSGEFNF